MQNPAKLADAKSSTVKFWREIVGALLASWPELADKDIRRIKPPGFRTWAKDFASSDSATRYNAALSAMRRVFAIAITHHDLRHLFATTCIKSGVDISTISRWLGHKDGGALAMRTYGHLRDDHRNRQAA